MKHLGDITRLNGAEIEPVDVITGGSPCQDLSIAGKQAGLSGSRSGLFHEQMRLVREMREATGGMYPHFMVWENVPGALSTNNGADFREVLNECVKIVEKAAPDVPMPEKGGWPKAGVLYDDLGRWSIAWRIHDAQYWGVPQRRRRIALVCDFRGMSAPEVLFEREGVRGDTAPRAAEGQGTAGNPGGSTTEADAVIAIEGNGSRPGHKGPGFSDADVSYTLNTVEHHAVAYKAASVYDARSNGSGETCATITGDHDNRITDYTNVVCAGRPIVIDRAAFNQGENAMFNTHIKEEETMATLVSRGLHAVCVVAANVSERWNGVSLLDERAHTLKTTTRESVLTFGNGQSPTNEEVYAIAEDGNQDVRLSKTAYSLACGGGKPGQSYPCICIGNGQADIPSHITEELSQTLTCVHDPLAILEPVASDAKVYGICSYSSNSMKSSNPHSGIYEAVTTRTLDAGTCGNPSCNQGGIAVVESASYKVRRLTPLECTRLQGYPDGWIDIGDWTDTKGKTHKDSDAPKYKALGNSIALPFWKWLLAGIYRECGADSSLGSLFDGIGGFPLSWPGRTAWSSEIEEFPLAVLRAHFGEESRQFTLPF